MTATKTHKLIINIPDEDEENGILALLQSANYQVCVGDTRVKLDRRFQADAIHLKTVPEEPDIESRMTLSFTPSLSDDGSYYISYATQQKNKFIVQPGVNGELKPDYDEREVNPRAQPINFGQTYRIDSKGKASVSDNDANGVAGVSWVSQDGRSFGISNDIMARVMIFRGDPNLGDREIVYDQPLWVAGDGLITISEDYEEPSGRAVVWFETITDDEQGVHQSRKHDFAAPVGGETELDYDGTWKLTQKIQPADKTELPKRRNVSSWSRKK